MGADSILSRPVRLARTITLAAAAVPLSVFEMAHSLPKVADALVRLAADDGPLQRLATLADAAPVLERIDARLQDLSGVEDSLQAIAAATDDINDLARAGALLPLLSGQAQTIADQATAVTDWLERFAPVLERLVETVGTLDATVGMLHDTLGPTEATSELLKPRRRPDPARPPPR
jgi:hypothetical protein